MRAVESSYNKVMKVKEPTVYEVRDGAYWDALFKLRLTTTDDVQKLVAKYLDFRFGLTLIGNNVNTANLSLIKELNFIISEHHDFEIEPLRAKGIEYTLPFDLTQPYQGKSDWEG